MSDSNKETGEMREPRGGPYHFKVEWSEEDQVYIGSFEASRMAHGDTPWEALRELATAFELALEVDADAADTLPPRGP